MAYSEDGRNVTLNAKVDLSDAQYKIVVNSTGGVGIPAADAFVHGILQNKPEADQHATVRTDGVSKVKAGAAIVQGAPITTAASGWATTAASGDCALGWAMTACNSGDTTTMFISNGGLRGI